MTALLCCSRPGHLCVAPDENGVERCSFHPASFLSRYTGEVYRVLTYTSDHRLRITPAGGMRTMRRTVILVAGAIWLGLGCGEAGTGPAPSNDGQRLAAQFERLADSVDAGGYSPAGDALRHAAEIVRLTGHATTVNVTLDGSARNFLAGAEQIDFPNRVCSWPTDSGVIQPPDPAIASRLPSRRSHPNAPSPAPTRCVPSSPGSRSSWLWWCA